MITVQKGARMISLAFSQKGDVIEKTMLLISIIRTDRLRQFLPIFPKFFSRRAPKTFLCSWELFTKYHPYYYKMPAYLF